MDELQVIRRCQSGDEAAFEAIYRQYAEVALRTAFLITHERSVAEDAVQETFVQVWRGIRGLRDVRAFRAWFYRILINRVRRLGKRDTQVPTVPIETIADRPDAHTPQPEEQMERNERLRWVQTAIAQLPESQRQTLVLRYYSGLSEAETAVVLGIPVGTVKSRLYTARTRLRDHLLNHTVQCGLPEFKHRQTQQE